MSWHFAPRVPEAASFLSFFPGRRTCNALSAFLILRRFGFRNAMAAGRQWPRPLAVRAVVLPGGHAAAAGRRQLGPGAGDLHLDAAPWLSLVPRAESGMERLPRRVVSLQHVGGFAWGPGRARRVFFFFIFSCLPSRRQAVFKYNNAFAAQRRLLNIGCPVMYASVHMQVSYI